MNIAKYIGIPWNVGGRDISRGLDCWGLLCAFYQMEFGIVIPPHVTPGQLSNAASVLEAAEKDPDWVVVEEPVEGDVVALGKDTFSHVAVVLFEAGVPYILQATHGHLSHAIALQRMTNLGWKLQRFYRHASRF